MLNHLPLNEIIDGCKQNKPGYCFELFRRVFDEKNQEAASVLYEQYNSLVFDWVFKSLKGYRVSEQDAEDLASQANLKFFKHMMKDVPLDSRYEHIAQLLAYWRTCVRTTVIDFLRKKRREDQIMERLAQGLLTEESSGLSLGVDIEQEECRQKIRELLNKHVSDEERELLRLKFEEGLTPREIEELYPDKYPVKKQYKIWDRVKKRLRKIFKIYLEECF